MTSSKPNLFHTILNWYFRILCILSVDLVISIINAKVLSLSSGHHRMIATLIGMSVVLILFLFLFSVIDKLTKLVLKFTVHMGNLIGFRKTAIFVIISGLLILIFSGYHFIWFGTWPDFKNIPIKI